MSKRMMNFEPYTDISNMARALHHVEVVGTRAFHHDDRKDGPYINVVLYEDDETYTDTVSLSKMAWKFGDVPEVDFNELHDQIFVVWGI